MVPYGNAQRNPRTGEITCQHGPDECTLNKAQNCAIYYVRAQCAQGRNTMWAGMVSGVPDASAAACVRRARLWTCGGLSCYARKT
eukprot:scaffold4044_cov399-Prasinococcus_capsulatus_cf.AAC.5